MNKKLNDKTIFLSAILFMLAPSPRPAAAMDDPITGRWITRDPIVYNLRLDRPFAKHGFVLSMSHSTSRQSVSALHRKSEAQTNHFAFLLSDPTNKYDPSGLLPPGCHSCGSCSVPQQEPCNVEEENAVVGRSAGTYCRSDGAIVACFKQGYEASHPFTFSCVLEHECKHACDHTNRDPRQCCNCKGRPTFPDEETLNQEEFDAYSIQWECIESLECNGNQECEIEKQCMSCFSLCFAGQYGNGGPPNRPACDQLCAAECADFAPAHE